jgi:hypothetical protein
MYILFQDWVRPKNKLRSQINCNYFEAEVVDGISSSSNLGEGRRMRMFNDLFFLGYLFCPALAP